MTAYHAPSDLVTLTHKADNRDYAEYSEDYQYRYVLKRNLQKHPNRWHFPVAFIMLNPGTATETQDDPTVRQCISFAKREGCTELFVLNLFAYRATDPKKLEKAKDPIGRLNDFKIKEIVSRVTSNGGKVVAAWGARPFARGRGAELEQKLVHFFVWDILNMEIQDIRCM
jgi:hypothetical protein